MSNYTQSNNRGIQFMLNEEDYWDLVVNQDNTGSYSFISPEVNDNCLSCYIDTANPECLSGDDLTSLDSYTWEGVCSNGLELNNIGLTGIDNGLIRYERDRIINQEFYNIYTNSKYVIESGDTRLHLHAVSGTTKLYNYPIINNEDGSVKLSGGFYQGFFRSADNYSVLPSNIDSEWNMEFLLRKDDGSVIDKGTLNEAYPDNKGIFFYIGTRAENKWYEFYKNPVIDAPCVDEEDDEEYFDDDYVEDELDLSKQPFKTFNGFNIESSNDGYSVSDNKFLMYDRTRTGLTVANSYGDEEILLAYKKYKSPKNLFLYLNHTPSGYTTNDIRELQEEDESGYSAFYSDLYENALAFFIDDNGCIGYKYLVKDCSGASEGFYSVLVGKSKENIIKASEWAKITVKIKTSDKVMKLYFYVNGKLKYITKELPKLRLRDLEELDEKEEGVAYNISLGGGTQGLSETIYPNYMCDPENVYPLEKYFAGTFFGDFKEFKFYTC